MAEISFPRTILYPKLEDNEIVLDYPDVKGMSENVMFFTHNHKEDGGLESVSKVNTFEVRICNIGICNHLELSRHKVKMIVDLVMYFLRQGVYNSQGDIAVLCAYLGQLQKVRHELRELKVTVAVDERDEDQLVRQGLQDEDETPSIEEVSVAKHVRYLWRTVGTWAYLCCGLQVRLGTVDIFQGQEAKIVIVSLVRNSGEFDTGNSSIGFLKVKFDMVTLLGPSC